jgi:microcystin-dependent protein
MSFRSSTNQRIINTTFHDNTIVDVDAIVLNSISSIDYVNTELETINTEISTINATIISLQNQINTLTNEIQRVSGSIIMSVSATVPPYTLLCDGSSYDITLYPTLFSIIGYAYGGSDGFFNVPNMQSCFPLGANGTLNGVPASNLISGNNAAGAKNNYYITGNPWTYAGSTLPNFCIQQKVPAHNHFIVDNGHQHGVGDGGYGSYSGSQTTFLVDTGTYNTQSAIAQTGITIQSSGSQIQQTDPISNIYGVNFTPPFIAVFFYINI